MKSTKNGDNEEISNVNFYDKKFYEHYNDRNSENYAYIEKVLLNLAVCHTVIIENKEGKINYNASSPDELALVNAARFFGMKFVERDEEGIVSVHYNDQVMKF